MQDIESVEYYEQMNKVVTALLKGETNPTTLARELGMTRVKVMDYMDAWKDVARNDEDIKNVAKESLTNMNVHYDIIIKEMWAVVNDPVVDLKTKAGTLKQIADIVSKRQETLQKAGLYDDAGLADELADTQEKAEGIKNLLREVAAKHPAAKSMILEGLSSIFHQPIVVDNIPLSPQNGITSV